MTRSAVDSEAVIQSEAKNPDIHSS